MSRFHRRACILWRVSSVDGGGSVLLLFLLMVIVRWGRCEVRRAIVRSRGMSHFRMFRSKRVTCLRCSRGGKILSVLRAVIPPRLRKRKVTRTLARTTIECTSIMKLGVHPAYSFTGVFFAQRARCGSVLIR